METGMGVDTNQYRYVQIAPVSELPAGERLFVEVDDQPIVILNVSDKLYAIGDVCTHDDGPLGDGQIDGCEIICPRHGARFDLRTGKATRLPAVQPTPWYPVRIVNEMIEIGLPA